MRVLVCGDRNWEDEDTIYQVLSAIHSSWENTERCITMLIEGDAPGADKLSAKVMKKIEPGCEIVKCPAHWAEFGKRAGPIRNKFMRDKYKPDLVIAFHSDIEKSKGTKNMLKLAKEKGIRTILVS